MATNVPDSIRVWNYKVKNQKLEDNGNIEHLRESMLDDGELLKPGHVYWLSERAPIESLPMKATKMSQFFKITTPEAGCWSIKDSLHYTSNPFGVLPGDLRYYS